MSYIKNSLLALAISFLVACGGGGGGGSVTPQLPADAVTITPANAESVAQTAVGTLDSLAAITAAAEVESMPSMQLAIDTVTDLVFDRDRRSQSVVSGVSETYPCSGGGSITYNYSGTDTSESGSVSFSSCIEFSLTINGSFSYNASWNNSTGDYTYSGSGSISYVYSSTSFTIAMTFSESGNEFDGTYSTNISYSVSGIPGGGFLVTTTQNIVGQYTTITGGQLMIQGANNTRVRVTVTGTNQAEVHYDDGSGTFVFIANIVL